MSSSARPEITSPPRGLHKLLARENLLPFVLVTALFFLWGIPNNLNDVLIRQFMKSFEITRFKAGLVQSSFYLGYFLLSTSAALVMRRFGYKTGLVTGLLLYACGTLLFWPAAIVGQYGFFLCARLSSPADWPFSKPARIHSSRNWGTRKAQNVA